MEYCITMERVQRISVYFNAESDEEAEKRAAEINVSTGPEDFDNGDAETDYALCESSSGRTIIDWE